MDFLAARGTYYFKLGLYGHHSPQAHQLGLPSHVAYDCYHKGI